MDWKNFFKDVAIGTVIVSAIGVAATIGWEAAIAYGFGLMGKVVVGTVTAAVLALFGKKVWNAKTEEKLAVPVVVNAVSTTGKKENQAEYDRQNNLIRQRPKRRFLGRRPSRLIARWRSRKAQQKENQREMV